MGDAQTAAQFRTEAFHYVLPPELIAQHPAQRRDQSRLLVVPARGPLEHALFSDLVRYLRSGDVVVANDARVLRARFLPRRKKGGRAEVLLLHPAADAGCWVAMARPGKRVRKGDRLALDDRCGIEIVDWAPEGERIVRFYGIEADDAMLRFGHIPLPPYIHNAPPDAAERYQTVYAAHDGSVAAPTAGLHFTPALIDEVRRRGVQWHTLTLHVGAGTFRPVKTDDIRAHAMHAESYEISTSTADAVNAALDTGNRTVAVGTTVLRALEACAADHDGRIVPGAFRTSIFIYPPFSFRVAAALITNFHLPRSTLLMLVCAFAGRERILAAYREAIEKGYRFYSFGDAMFLEKGQ